MKKLTLVLAFAFVAGMSFAQNVDDIDQWGDGNYANAVQQHYFTAGNVADIDQLGNQNINYLYQEITGMGAGNTAELTQWFNNSSDIWVFQIGEGNILDVMQEGTAVTPGVDNQTWVTQLGLTNEAYVGMFSTMTKSRVFQSGTINEALQMIGVNTDDSHSSVMVSNSKFDIQQYGIDNLAGQHLVGGLVEMDNNKGTILQFGNENNAWQSMYGDGAYNWVSGNMAELSQIGNNNNSAQYQTGALNSTSHVQLGSGNTALTSQNNTLWTTANWGFDGAYNGTLLDNVLFVVSPLPGL